MSRRGRQTDRETREFLVDVRVNELPKNWTIGQRAEVFLETGRESEVILLPQEYLVWNAGRAGVFVAADGRARWHEVTLGLRGPHQVAVHEGLNAGEIAIRPKEASESALTDGQRIAQP